MNIEDVMRSLRLAMGMKGPYALLELRNMFHKVDYQGSIVFFIRWPARSG